MYKVEDLKIYQSLRGNDKVVINVFFYNQWQTVFEEIGKSYYIPVSLAKKVFTLIMHFHNNVHLQLRLQLLVGFLLYKD